MKIFRYNKNFLARKFGFLISFFLEIIKTIKSFIKINTAGRLNFQNKEKSTFMTNKDREFTKLVRKLENKLHLDPEIYKKSNLNSDQADALKNFKTSSNALSVYIADDQEKIPRILAAIAAGCDKPEKVDYAVFEFSILERCGITSYKKCKGKTPDIEVNDLHIDLKDLTVSQVSLLIQNIREEGELERISKKDITEIITDGIQRKLLQKEHVNAKILKFVTSHC